MTREQYFEQLSFLKTYRGRLNKVAVEIAIEVIHKEFPAVHLTSAARTSLRGDHTVSVCERRDRFDVDLRTEAILYIGSDFITFRHAAAQNLKAYTLERHGDILTAIAWSSPGHAAVMRFNTQTAQRIGKIDTRTVWYSASGIYINYEKRRIYLKHVAG